jgi:hypothetical protein
MPVKAMLRGRSARLLASDRRMPEAGSRGCSNRPLPSSSCANTGNPAFIILDVRTPQEFRQGHIEGAVLLDYYAPDFRDRFARWTALRPFSCTAAAAIAVRTC